MNTTRDRDFEYVLFDCKPGDRAIAVAWKAIAEDFDERGVIGVRYAGPVFNSQELCWVVGAGRRYSDKSRASAPVGVA